MRPPRNAHYQSLRGPSVAFWSSPERRRLALEGLYQAWVDDNAAAFSAQIQATNALITEILIQIGLPRSLIREIRVVAHIPGANGQKTPDCSIRLGATFLSDAL